MFDITETERNPLKASSRGSTAQLRFPTFRTRSAVKTAGLAGFGCMVAVRWWFSLIKRISQQWAICEDCRDKGLLSLMDILPGVKVPAMWGRAKCQPKVSNANVRETSRSYEGGARQLIIPVNLTDRQIMPGLVSVLSQAGYQYINI
jgi:hypothetical protein